MIPEGMVVLASNYGPQETMRNLIAAVNEKGLAIFAQVDHAAAAAEIGMELRPTNLLIFGSPKAGTPLMQAAQTMGIDLPLKALVWQDAENRTWLGYNDPGSFWYQDAYNDLAAAGAVSEGLPAPTNGRGFFSRAWHALF